jgi:hypothetical protein
MKTNRISIIAGVIAGLLTAFLASAQPDRTDRPGRRSVPPEGPPPAERPSGERSSGAMRAPGSYTPGPERIFTVLTQEQRMSLREVMLENREQSQEMERKIRNLRAELLDDALARDFREEAFRRKAMEVAKLEAERMTMMAKAFSQVQPPLSSRQVEQLKRSGPPQSNNSDRNRQRNSRPPRDRNDQPPRE